MKVVVVTGGAGKSWEGSARQSSLSLAILSGELYRLPLQSVVVWQGVPSGSFYGRGIGHLWVESLVLTCRFL